MENQRNIFDVWNDNIRQAEASIVNLVSAIAPWGAPLPAAYMSYSHMDLVLKFPGWVAIPVALVIEILGFSVVSTILGFWSHNKKYQDDAKKAPIDLVLVAFGFYLAIVLTMNVLIDASAGEWWQGGAIIAVRALLTLMSIPAALVLAVRTQHQELLNDMADSKRERAFKRQYGDKWFEMLYGASGSQGSQNQRTSAEPSEKYQEVWDYISAFYSTNDNQLPKLADIMESCKVVKSYASRIRSEWKMKNLESGL